MPCFHGTQLYDLPFVLAHDIHANSRHLERRPWLFNYISIICTSENAGICVSISWGNAFALHRLSIIHTAATASKHDLAVVEESPRSGSRGIRADQKTK